MKNYKCKSMKVRCMMRQIKQGVRLSILVTVLFTMVACNEEKITIIPETSERTLFLYYPWSSDLTQYFTHNISDMESVLKKTDMKGQKVIVFISTTATEASLFELKRSGDEVKREILKNYSSPPYTTAAGITSFVNDVKEFAPAKVYSMIIGSHGMGWLPVETAVFDDNLSRRLTADTTQIYKTRFYGGETREARTDINTLAKGIDGAGIKMEYILFDDCYMSSVEVAYELKNVTKYLIGSTSEMMAYGMPYSTIGKSLFGDPDYQAVCDSFYSFYSKYDPPCGTLSVTDCSQLDSMATLMKKINANDTFDEHSLDSLQQMDGYTPHIFYDYGNYVEHLCTNVTLLDRFKEQLIRLIPYKVHTKYFYTMKGGMMPIHTFSGITTSDPSISPAAATKNGTKWYQATH